MSKITRYQDLVERDHLALVAECRRIEREQERHREIMRSWKRNGLALEITGR